MASAAPLDTASGYSLEASYLATGSEFSRLSRLLQLGFPTVLQGPTGCGKTTLIQALATAHGRPLEFVVGNQDLSPSDLLGRWHLGTEGSVWRDGPLTRAVRQGGIFYFDEIGNTPDDVLQTVYSVIDHRRLLVIPAIPEQIEAAPGFWFVAAYNPGYGSSGGSFTPAFRQRLRFMQINYLPAEKEQNLLMERTGVSEAEAKFLVQVGSFTREKLSKSIVEGASTRVLLSAACELRDGATREQVVTEVILPPLTDDLGLRDSALRTLESTGIIPSSLRKKYSPAPEEVIDDLPDMDDSAATSTV